jgi:hypothetical protein
VPAIKVQLISPPSLSLSLSSLHPFSNSLSPTRKPPPILSFRHAHPDTFSLSQHTLSFFLLLFRSLALPLSLSFSLSPSLSLSLYLSLSLSLSLPPAFSLSLSFSLSLYFSLFRLILRLHTPSGIDATDSATFGRVTFRQTTQLASLSPYLDCKYICLQNKFVAIKKDVFLFKLHVSEIIFVLKILGT